MNLFERLTRRIQGQDGSDYHTKHLDGAITLVLLRGKKQFEDPIARRIFLTLNTSVVTSCDEREVEVPTKYLKLRSQASQSFDATDPLWGLSDVMLELTLLQNAMKKKELPVSRIVAAAKEIGDRLQDLSLAMSQQCTYEVVTRVDVSDAILSEFFHVYSDHDILRDWNKIRGFQILLYDLIQEYLVTYESENPCLDFETDTQSSMAVTSISEICASLPQYTVPAHTADSPERYRVLALLFPLYISARSASCPRYIRDWILYRLLFIGQKMGVTQAITIRDSLVQGTDRNPWKVFATLESLLHGI